MECPYCHNSMQEGVIYGDRYAIKWIEASKAKGIFARMFQEGIKLTNPWTTNKVEACYCMNCRKMIIDVKEEIE